MDSGYYLYAVSKVDVLQLAASLSADRGSEPCELTGIHFDHDLEQVTCKKLTAIISEVPLSEFGQEELRQNINNLEWLERTARKHDRIIRNLSLVTSIVPVRFATVFRSKTGIEQFIEQHCKQLDALLESIDGCWEVGVTLAFDRDEILKKLKETDQQMKQLSEKIDRSQAGTAYLFKKRLELMLNEKFNSFVEQELEQSKAILKKWSKVVKEEQSSQIATNGSPLLVKLSCLTHVSDIEQLRATIESMQATSTLGGKSVHLSGPWPPYSFSKLDTQTTLEKPQHYVS